MILLHFIRDCGIPMSKISDEMEKAIHNANSMDDIRRVSQKTPEFKQHFKESLRPTKELLACTLSRLSLKGEAVVVEESCTEDSINTLFSCVQKIEPVLKRTDTHQAHLKKLPNLVQFMDHCCLKRKYFFCVKKCGVADCNICRQPRLPSEVFLQLHHFPDPLRKLNSESYMDFHDVWGTSTTEKDRPSLATKKSPDQSPIRKSGEAVRELVICGECLKVRCVYSAKTLTKEQLLEFRRCKEDNMYVCGTTVIPQENPLKEICYFEAGINCDSVISPHYFSSRHKFPQVCYVCGVFSDLVPIFEN